MNENTTITLIRDTAAAHSWTRDRDGWIWYNTEHNTPDMRFTPDSKVWELTFKEFRANRRVYVYVDAAGVVLKAAWRDLLGDWQPISGDAVVDTLIELGSPTWKPVPVVAGDYPF